ncbi:UDP-N-acetylmuramate dehydrogenase [Candidatus Poribacteria bacterium]|jgi:UDP-N-acetylmuramate dehydrogenase|nr:UDP-N-acetylmuramate dehydrogenase [Candidatus Poribacteria bacterium]MBT5714636.1 UDP-N-acetylmuramate dehydrogenase [Candidatus Poribacteria bacterium]MBT7101320.1 UDP-N-acetylmuramate dehydrogenase [Candidatus Poribacteria bacterium]MBT7806365.1 UDP-N-acetylmuramate dehydrogenase [Candidatus Poribacteria bacterium]
MAEPWTAELGAISGLRVRWDEPLARYTTYKVGGPADALVWADDAGQAEAVLAVAKGCDVPVLPLGRGSNMLVADKGVRGIVLKLGREFDTVEADGDTVTAGAAVPMSVMSKECAKRGLSGAEFLFGIPGSMGGGIRMNAGAHGASVADIALGARALGWDGATHDLSAADLGFAYRTSQLGAYFCGLRGTFRLEPDDPTRVEAKTKEYYYQRLASQPLDLPSAGCVFRNPDVASAGKLIDDLGLKGLSSGAASVSEKHANFLVAADGATAEDVGALICDVRRRVFDACGVRLELEIKLVGEEPPQVAPW